MLPPSFVPMSKCPRAGPGRWLQLLGVMGKPRGVALRSDTATCVVFDEAARLFEGTLAAFAAAILGHQDASATMAPDIVEFSRTVLLAMSTWCVWTRALKCSQNW